MYQSLLRKTAVWAVGTWYHGINQISCSNGWFNGGSINAGREGGWEMDRASTVGENKLD